MIEVYIGRRTDDAVYEVRRVPPYTVVRAEGQGGDAPISVGLIGFSANFIVSILEPEQKTLLGSFAAALKDVRVGAPQLIRYRTMRHGVTARVAEVVDRGPEHENLYIFCYRDHDWRPAVVKGV